MRKAIFLIISLFIGFLVYKKNNEIIIPNESIRVRIIANSDNIKDLYEKKKLKEELKGNLYNIVKDAKNINEASLNLKRNMSEIEKVISNKTSDYKINYGMNYFPKKNYKGVIYNEGEYESLVITLGKGLGENWWCVLYPPLCLLEENSNTSDVEYKLAIQKLLSN